ncbi:iron-containing alcohol dehydrogenase family protein [Salinarchaeum sp. Harcht-Bsk1]|uniref:iron-containing alcohol dehydrogenase family protein n=1 Tax=Salinarchaeum sp. Harcht-Bsk1 TaxID=1333523 RepID=UPI0006778A77|nr:iron-containing alcohol dehydrogenase family protein [Salinarchaeum sp. Harcht-Bsk1]
MTDAVLLEGSGPFRLDYDPGAIRYGAGATASLSDDLAEMGFDRALVVTGTTIGETAAVMDPVSSGLGDRLAGVFAETTPEKRLSTAVAGAAAARERDADVLVAVGGGSSIDTAKAIATVRTRDDDPQALGAEFAERQTLTVPDDPLPIVAVPTTFAGADFTIGAGLSASPAAGDLVDAEVAGGLGGTQLGPVEAVYDPEVVATTPRSILAGSAMNGFDKAIETLYSRHATAITDATATRGVRRFREGLLAFGEAGSGDYHDGVPAAVEGLLLAQYGISRTDCTTMSVIHAAGQAVSARGDVQQGVAHAICAPHLLEHLLETAAVRIGLVANAFGVADGADPETSIVDELVAVRDALGVTTALRDVPGIDREDLPEIAAAVADHRFVANGPADYEPTAPSLEAVLDAAW